MRLLLACWCVSMWGKYTSARLPFNLTLETYFQGDLLFTSRIQNPVWTLMFYFQCFEQICVWQVWKAGMHPMVWVLLCKYTCIIELQVILFQWLEEKPREKNNLKGKRWRIKLQLLWLFWLEMSDCWSERRNEPAAFWLHPFSQLLENEF